MSSEGVVTRIQGPGETLPEERIRFVLDPSETWSIYAERWTSGIPTGPRTLTPAAPAVAARPIDRAAQKLDDAARRLENAAGEIDNAQANDAPAAPTAPAAPARARATAARPAGVPIVVTRRTNIFRHARTMDGTDLLQGNPADTEVQTTRTGTVVRDVVPAQRPQPANVTNIREGSFVTVRFRRVGDINEALSLSIVEPARTAAPVDANVPLTTTPVTTTPAATTVVPGATTVVPGATTVAPSATVPGTTTIPPTGRPLPPGTTTPPVVPTDPTTPLLPVRGVDPGTAPNAPSSATAPRVPSVPVTPVAPVLGPM